MKAPPTMPAIIIPEPSKGIEGGLEGESEREGRLGAEEVGPESEGKEDEG